LLAIVDTSALYAAADRDDRDHARSLAALQHSGLRRIIPALVVAETTYLIGRRLGPTAEAGFLAALPRLDVLLPEPDDWNRIAELVREYADFPLGGTDASIVALAERLAVDVIITLDRRHFSAVRPRHCASFRLLPE
jgi:uncharacterized protein